MKRNREYFKFTLAFAAIMPTMAIAEDAVFGMCMELDTEQVCSCASETLREQISKEDYAIFDAIGADYLARLEAGEGRVDAWMAASRTEASKRGIGSVALMGRTNEISDAHRLAIKDCGG